MKPPFGHTIFCDDIRYEEGGKQSLIGIYRHSLFFHGEFPLVLPKLVLSIYYFEPADDCADSIDLNVYFPGDDQEKPTFSANIQITPDKMPQIGGERSKPPKDMDTVITMQPVFELAQVAFKEEGFMKVRAVRRGEIIKLSSLYIAQAPPPDT